MKSWKTTVMGIATIAIALGNAALAAFDGKPETVFDMSVLIAAITAGAGLIAARDADVSSEKQGLK